MPVSDASLAEQIRAAFPGSESKVYDISGGCGQSYEVLIVSSEFEGLTTLKRHRLVNERLKEPIAQLHAFVQKTHTPAQYAKLNAQAATPATDPASAPA